MITLTLPIRFWDDHAERCDEGCHQEVKRTSRDVVVTLDDAALADLESDADYYASPYGPDAPGLSGLKASARATLSRLQTYRLHSGDA